MTKKYVIEIDFDADDVDWLKQVREDTPEPEEDLDSEDLIKDLDDYALQEIMGHKFAIMDNGGTKQKPVKLNHLAPGEEPPKGAHLYVGPRGGRYYYYTGDSSITDDKKRAPDAHPGRPEGTRIAYSYTFHRNDDVKNNDITTWVEQLKKISGYEGLTPKEKEAIEKAKHSLHLLRAINKEGSNEDHNVMTIRNPKSGELYGAMMWTRVPEELSIRYNIPRSIVIEDLCSSPNVVVNRTRKGVATRLMYELFKNYFLTDPKLEEVCLSPYESAVPFYQRIGFEGDPNYEDMTITRRDAQRFVEQYEAERM